MISKVIEGNNKFFINRGDEVRKSAARLVVMVSRMAANRRKNIFFDTIKDNLKNYLTY